MWTQFLIQFWILLIITLGAAVLLGRYIGTVFAPVAIRKNDWIGKVERRLLLLLGVDERKQRPVMGRLCEKSAARQSVVLRRRIRVTPFSRHPAFESERCR